MMKTIEEGGSEGVRVGRIEVEKMKEEKRKKKKKEKKSEREIGWEGGRGNEVGVEGRK
jgi:hypothetical protein